MFKISARTPLELGAKFSSEGKVILAQEPFATEEEIAELIRRVWIPGARMEVSAGGTAYFPM